jgi:hypothetical protein
MSDRAQVKKPVDEILKKYSALSLEDKTPVLNLIDDARAEAIAKAKAAGVEHEKFCYRPDCEFCEILEGDFPLNTKLQWFFYHMNEKTVSDGIPPALYKRAYFATYALKKSAEPSPPQRVIMRL